LNISPAQVSRIIGTYNKDGRATKLPQGGPRREKLQVAQKEKICDWVDQDCTLTAKQIASKLLVEYGIVVSRKPIERCLKEFHYSFKRVSLVPERRNDPDVIEAWAR
jgi:transposase